eukprot:TRINITY_DN22642_c0_g1_i1.p2 TRINITY_DN22642_c0_g1~~TRINITY_DN22642_c0_g1_i1.p2  ORF type:complete len:189 (+),score=27.82 TRINITY_DN22642_c0_g1_i1:167-733(+)
MAWYWKQNLSAPDSNIDAWVAYGDADSIRIERAFCRHQKTFKLSDEHRLDFVEMIQYRLEDRNRQRPIRRMTPSGFDRLRQALAQFTDVVSDGVAFALRPETARVVLHVVTAAFAVFAAIYFGFWAVAWVTVVAIPKVAVPFGSVCALGYLAYGGYQAIKHRRHPAADARAPTTRPAHDRAHVDLSVD